MSSSRGGVLYWLWIRARNEEDRKSSVKFLASERSVWKILWSNSTLAGSAEVLGGMFYYSEIKAEKEDQHNEIPHCWQTYVYHTGAMGCFEKPGIREWVMKGSILEMVAHLKSKKWGEASCENWSKMFAAKAEIFTFDTFKGRDWELTICRQTFVREASM